MEVITQKGNKPLPKKGNTIVDNTKVDIQKTPIAPNGAKEVPNLLDDHQYHIRIIGMYILVAGVKHENKKQQRDFINRHTRAASKLTGYTEEQILKTMEYLQKTADYKWTLETVGKFIDFKPKELTPEQDARQLIVEHGLNAASFRFQKKYGDEMYLKYRESIFQGI